MKIFSHFLITLFSFSENISGQSLFSHGRLKTSKDGHYLQFQDGIPFLGLGDTAWELFHRLNLTEIKQYLENRASKSFNVNQAVDLEDKASIEFIPPSVGMGNDWVLVIDDASKR